jgi:hypothetical protein
MSKQMERNDTEGADRPVDRPLSPAKLRILHYIMEQGEYNESIVQLSRDMGLQSDSNVNKNLNELVRGGYLTVGPPFKVTNQGLKELGFSRLPDAVLAILGAVGAVDVLVGLMAILGLGPINPLSTISLGVVVVFLTILFYIEKKRIYRRFLGFREPL